MYYDVFDNDSNTDFNVHNMYLHEEILDHVFDMLI